MTPTVRQMRRDDAGRVLDLWEALMAAGNEADARYLMASRGRGHMAEAIRSWTVSRPFPRALVAEVDGVLVGIVAGAVTPNVAMVAGPEIVRISDLFVAREVRRSGIARALVEAFLLRARAAGFTAFEVSTLTHDEQAVAFWTAMGFGPWRVILRRDQGR